MKGPILQYLDAIGQGIEIMLVAASQLTAVAARAELKI
jgi:hypothetical protein